MKKILITLVIIATSFLLKAQTTPVDVISSDDFIETDALDLDDFIKPGRVYAGGTISLRGMSEKHEESNSSTNGPKESSFTVLPEVGYILNKKLAVDLALGWSSTTSTTYEPNFDSQLDDWELKEKSGMFIFAPMVRGFKKLSNRLYCSPTLGVMMGFGSYSNEYVGYNDVTFEEEIRVDEYSETAFGVDARAALTFFPSKHWGLSFSYGSVYYNSTTRKSKDDSNIKWKDSSYGLDLRPSSIRVGAHYFF